MSSPKFLFYLILVSLGIQASALGDDFFRKEKVECENLSECPENAGRLISWLKGEQEKCSGALVAPDVVITAAHCVFTELQKKALRERGHYQFIFPKTKTKSEERIEVAGVLYNAIPAGDVAFLKLARRSERKPFDIDTSGIADGEELTIYKVHDIEANHAKLFASHCKAVQNSLLNPFFDQNISRKFVASHCPLVVTDSGAPAVARNGKIKGVITEKFYRGQMDQTAAAHLKAAMGTDNIQSVLDGFAAGSNLACIKNLSDGFKNAVPDVCKSQATDDSAEVNKRLASLFDHKLSELMKTSFDPDAWIRTQPPGIQWQLTLIKKPEVDSSELVFTHFIAGPHCLLKNSTLDKNVKLITHRWDFLLKFDEDLRPSIQKNEANLPATELRLKECDPAHQEPYVLNRL